MSVKRIDRQNLLYVSGGLVLAAMLGMSVGEAFVWAALWIMNKDFVRLFGLWYVKAVMVGLAASAIFQYWLSSTINLPAGFTAGALAAAGVWAGLYGHKRGR
jgi:hypothetical protein